MATVAPCSFLTAALALLLVSCAHAQSIEGRVVGVHDGDTLTVLDAEKVQHKIRLSAIDAPEEKQAFGERAKQTLSRLAFGEKVRVEVHGKDKYGRALGDVYAGGKRVNLAMVEEGMAWAYKGTKDAALLAAEGDARQEKRGLWLDKAPVAPREFRAEVKAK
jgi:endonuclease YncB( thermonuclease family)